MHFFTFARLWAYTGSLSFFLLLCCCAVKNDLPLNEVTPDDDVAIGKTIDKAYLQHLDTLPNQRLLSEQDYTGVYQYLYRMCKQIENSPVLSTAVDAAHPLRQPTLRVLQAPSKTGAFVAPGGYLYIYTELLEVLDHEAELVPILAHLINCSVQRYDVRKLEAHFSTNFLLDLAIGTNVNGGYNSAGTDVEAIIHNLESKPYSKQEGLFLDDYTEDIVCALGYDVQVYANLYLQNNSYDLDWFALFPRERTNNAYAAYLFNTVRDSTTCSGPIGVGDYAAFKTLLP